LSKNKHDEINIRKMIKENNINNNGTEESNTPGGHSDTKRG
jgi:hypothetical protein